MHVVVVWHTWHGKAELVRPLFVFGVLRSDCAMMCSRGLRTAPKQSLLVYMLRHACSLLNGVPSTFQPSRYHSTGCRHRRRRHNGTANQYKDIC